MSRALSCIYGLLVYAFIFLPVAALILFSFQGSQIPVPPFNGPSLKWYASILADTRITTGLGNSLIVALVSSLVATLMGFLAAWGVARFALRWSAFWKGLITLPLTVAYLIIAMGLLIFFNRIGIAKSLFAVGIGHVVINMPLCFAIILSQMTANQANIERAARDLGAADWQVLFLITAPMLAPALFASFFLSFTFSWDEFIIAFLLTRFETTLPVEIWNMLRAGLSPKTNAVGSLVFFVSVSFVIMFEIFAFRKRSQ
jgi:spermidine/putrescine transport system permease protein